MPASTLCVEKLNNMIIIGNLLILIGATFLFLGALGLVRMPDVYNRIQAGTKATTLGTLAMLAGVAFHHPTWLPKIILIALFILLTSPVASSTIARAAKMAGLQAFSLRAEKNQQEET